MKYWLFIISTSLITSACNTNVGDKKEGSVANTGIIKGMIADINKYPDSAGLRMRLVNTYDSLKMYKQAISQTDSLIKRDSLNNGLWFTKGQLQEDSGDTSAAIDSYTKAVNVYPSVEAQLHLANLYAETKNPKSVFICERVSKLGMGRETDADCNFIAGIYYSRIGNGKKAVELFDKAINDNYTLMEAYMEKGFVYYDNTNYAEALKVFETAITINNTYADAYYWKAKCEEASGDKANAINDYKRSLGLDQQLKEARDAIKRLE